MKDRYLYALWGVLFVMTAALGLIPEPSGGLAVVMLLLSLAFFIPPGLVLYRAWKRKDRFAPRLIRDLAAGSLALTTVILVANFLSVLASEWIGDALHAMLVVVSTPMVCCGIWIIPLFLWACLLVTGSLILKRLKK